MIQPRLFVALDLPASIQDSIEKQTATLRHSLGDDLARWVSPPNLHLTLKFIGDIPASHLDFLKLMLTQAADSCPSFDLQISGLGSFPNSKRPRILWAGVSAPAVLASLQKTIEDGAQRLGYEREARPFSPHLTLGRVRQGCDPKDLAKIGLAISKIQLGKIGTARVDSIHLYSSDLRAGGASYTKLFSAPLR